MDELETQATAAVKHRNKTNKINKHNTENQNDEQHGPHQETGGTSRCSRRVSSMI
jgi:hypothetical protein